MQSPVTSSLTDLRQYIEALRGLGEIQEIDAAVALDLELGQVLAIAAHVPVAAPAQWSATSKKLYLNLAPLSLRR